MLRQFRRSIKAQFLPLMKIKKLMILEYNKRLELDVISENFMKSQVAGCVRGHRQVSHLPKSSALETFTTDSVNELRLNINQMAGKCQKNWRKIEHSCNPWE
jgi:hypothetical protein